MELKILKFGATWCQPCRTLDPVMEDVQKEYSDLLFEKYDADTHPDVFKKYKISSVPTVVFVKDDNEVNRFSGVLPKSQIISLINKYL